MFAPLPFFVFLLAIGEKDLVGRPLLPRTCLLPLAMHTGSEESVSIPLPSRAEQSSEKPQAPLKPGAVVSGFA